MEENLFKLKYILVLRKNVSATEGNFIEKLFSKYLKMLSYYLNNIVTYYLNMIQV